MDDIQKHMNTSWSDFLRTRTMLQRDWCYRHPSDISGWSFLSFLLPRVDAVADRALVVQGVVEFAGKFRLHNESLWVFLRTVLSDGTLHDQRNASLQILYQLAKEIRSSKERSAFSDRVLNTIEWIDTRGVPDLCARPAGIPPGT